MVDKQQGSSQKLSGIFKNQSIRQSRLSVVKLIIFALVFVSIGSYALLRTFASTNNKSPVNLSAVAASPSQINLAWKASSDGLGVTGYDVYRDSIKIANVSTTSYGDTGLGADTVYNYYVVALDSAGMGSQPSNSVNATTSTPHPTSTGAFTITVTDQNQQPVPGVTISTSVNGVKRRYITTSQGSYVAAGLPPGSYNFKASAEGYQSSTIDSTVNPAQTTIINLSLMKN